MNPRRPDVNIIAQLLIRVLVVIFLAASWFSTAIAVEIAANSVEDQGYTYPFSDPLVATVVGTPMQWRAVLPKAPSVNYKLAVQVDRKVPDVFWYQDGLRYSLAEQKAEAPMVFVIAGTGAGFDSGKMKVLESVLYSSGYHVVSLSSPTYPNFIVTASTSGVPGHLRDDADDLYHVMKRIRDRHSNLKISEYAVGGYSLGAANAAYVGRLDQSLKVFNFQRVMMINPPVNLFSSVLILDQLLEDNLSTDPASIEKFLGRAFDALASFQDREGTIDLSADGLYKMYNHAKPDDTVLSSLIGAAFRLSSSTMIFTSDVIVNRGYLKPKDLVLGSADSLTIYSKAAIRIPFDTYFEEYFHPFFKQKYPGISQRQLIDALSLYPIEDYLKNTPGVFLITNRDDFILAPGEVDYLIDVFGSKAKVFPTGGHCGNMAQTQFVTQITEMMEL